MAILEVHSINADSTAKGVLNITNLKVQERQCQIPWNDFARGCNLIHIGPDSSFGLSIPANKACSLVLHGAKCKHKHPHRAISYVFTF